MSYTLLLEEWWENHWMRVSTVAQAAYGALSELIHELLLDLPNEENQ